MEKRCSYAFGRTLALDFGAVVQKVDHALAARRISILFRLGMDRFFGREGSSPGLLLGVFPSSLSPSVFRSDPNLGLLVPCQLAIYADGGQTTVMIMDNTCLMDLLRDPAAIAMLMESRSQLEEILESL